MSFSKNLKWLRLKEGYTQEALSEKLGVQRPMISAYEDGRSVPKLEGLSLIAKTFQITLDDLVHCDLEKWEEMRYDKIPEKVLSITLDQHGEELITFVPQKAAAGYLNGFSDTEYVEKLPQFRLPQLPTGKTYRAFELNGDSMLPLESGTVIVGAFVGQLMDIRNGSTYILVTKSEGVVYKRVFNYLKESGKLFLVSDNSLYKPYEVHGADVVEAWEAKAFISTSFPTPKPTPQELTLDDLAEMIRGLRDEIKKCQ
jgi:transcriptional regulator with XRE-family HTH domain